MYILNKEKENEYFKDIVKYKKGRLIFQFEINRDGKLVNYIPHKTDGYIKEFDRAIKLLLSKVQLPKSETSIPFTLMYTKN